MNKAFLKEPENLGGRCPRCNSVGIAVPAETLQAFLSAEQRGNLSKSAYFCDYARCAVAYFDDFERVVMADELSCRVWPKDQEAPICACFGLTADDVAADVREGGVARVKAVVAKAKTAEARCATSSPRGVSCVAEVQRYYFKLRNNGVG